MSDELERLRADLEVLERYQRDYAMLAGAAIIDTKNSIARLEAEAADPWREAKDTLRAWGGIRHKCKEREIGRFFDHLTAENDRLAARVAELEAESLPIDPDGHQLGDFRVMKTAQEIARYAMDRNMDHPVTVKTARRAIWAIKEFVEQARHWHGLSKMKPYRWTSLGRDDTKFIDEDFDATESPFDYDPDDHKPLGDMQPPFEGPVVGFEPILDPARVLATVAELMDVRRYHGAANYMRLESGDAKPYRLKGTKTEVRRLIGSMRNMLGWFDEQVIRTYGEKRFDDAMTSPIRLDPKRTVATVAKMLVDQGEEQLAGVLVQILGSGVPYEVEGGGDGE